MPESCSIVIPIYNEEQSIGKVIHDISMVIARNKLKNINIICVNDASSDNTQQVLKKIPNIKIIHNTKRLGYGATIKKGISHTQAQWVMILDADNTYPADKIPTLLNARSAKTAMIVGKRQGLYIWTSPMRVLVRTVFQLLVCAKTGQYIPDINSGMRVFKRSVYLKISDRLSNRYSFTTTISFHIVKHKYLVTFIPIYYAKRIGSSKVSFYDYWKSIILFFTILFDK